MKSLPLIFAGLFRDLADWLDLQAIPPADALGEPVGPAPATSALPAITSKPRGPRTFGPRPMEQRLYWRKLPSSLSDGERAVLEALDITGQPMSRADLHRQTGLDHYTINKAVTKLRDLGLVIQRGAGRLLFQIVGAGSNED